MGLELYFNRRVFDLLWIRFLFLYERGVPFPLKRIAPAGVEVCERFDLSGACVLGVKFYSNDDILF